MPRPRPPRCSSGTAGDHGLAAVSTWRSRATISALSCEEIVAGAASSPASSSARNTMTTSLTPAGVIRSLMCEAMDPVSPWSKNTLQARVSELRKRLGADAKGNFCLPRDRSGGYRLTSAIRCDWDAFKELAEAGLRKGPAEGIADLETALALVRGRPLSGGTHAWATSQVQQIISRITDTAHTAATWHRQAPRPNLDARTPGHRHRSRRRPPPPNRRNHHSGPGRSDPCGRWLTGAVEKKLAVLRSYQRAHGHLAPRQDTVLGRRRRRARSRGPARGQPPPAGSPGQGPGTRRRPREAAGGHRPGLELPLAA